MQIAHPFFKGNAKSSPIVVESDYSPVFDTSVEIIGSSNTPTVGSGRFTGDGTATYPSLGFDIYKAGIIGDTVDGALRLRIGTSVADPVVAAPYVALTDLYKTALFAPPDLTKYACRSVSAICRIWHTMDDNDRLAWPAVSGGYYATLFSVDNMFSLGINKAATHYCLTVKWDRAMPWGGTFFYGDNTVAYVYLPIPAGLPSLKEFHIAWLPFDGTFDSCFCFFINNVLYYVGKPLADAVQTDPAMPIIASLVSQDTGEVVRFSNYTAPYIDYCRVLVDSPVLDTISPYYKNRAEIDAFVNP